MRNKLYQKKKSQPRPHGAFPWLWPPPKPRKRALGTRLEIFTESSRNRLFYDSAVLGGSDNHYTTETKKGGKLNGLNKVNAYEIIFNLTCCTHRAKNEGFISEIVALYSVR